jgi:hypothetical protein
MTVFRCPSCGSDLEQLFSIKGVFQCSNEDVFWRLVERKNVHYLLKAYAPKDYKGIRIAKVDV